VLLFQRQYPNEGVMHFVVQLKRFLADANRTNSPPVVACIAMAGPVTDNTCFMTNRGWVINGYELGLELGIRDVRLVNDFVAAGYGLLTLDLATEVRVVQVSMPHIAVTPYIIISCSIVKCSRCSCLLKSTNVLLHLYFHKCCVAFSICCVSCVLQNVIIILASLLVCQSLLS
jgi:Glucokinase